jgi:hypothetical protein
VSEWGGGGDLLYCDGNSNNEFGCVKIMRDRYSYNSCSRSGRVRITWGSW